MGATAITVVASARIVDTASAPMVDATRGPIAGTAVFFWAFGAWLIRESWVALAAWVTTFAAMLISSWRTLATGGLRSQGFGSTTMS